MYDIASYSLANSDLALLFISAALIGMAKTGVNGAGMIAVPLLAIVFGGKASTGLMLPMMVFADLFGAAFYRRDADWYHLRRLLPFTLIGILIGVFTGNHINDQLFSQLMAVIIFSSLAMMVWREFDKNPSIPSSLWFSASIGIVAGFATMVGNLAGSVMVLYLIAMRLPKNKFIGTAVWFFLIINLIKVPLHIWAWETININSFTINLMALPAIAAGALLGVKIIKQIPETLYRWFVLAMTAVAAIALIF